MQEMMVVTNNYGNTNSVSVDKNEFLQKLYQIDFHENLDLSELLSKDSMLKNKLFMIINWIPLINKLCIYHHTNIGYLELALSNQQLTINDYTLIECLLIIMG